MNRFSHAKTSLTLASNLPCRVQPKLPINKDVDPLLEIDRNEHKLEMFLTSHMPIITVGDMRRFLPSTINIDPYLRKLIRGTFNTADA